jgi:hypothetical protein
MESCGQTINNEKHDQIIFYSKFKIILIYLLKTLIILYYLSKFYYEDWDY